jgi:DNA-binding PadR family transcriptional regulator
MSKPEALIMRHFRNYRAGVGEMLFFESGLAKTHPPEFYDAMSSLVRNGLVVEEQRRGAYSLTARGYKASLRVQKAAM